MDVAYEDRKLHRDGISDGLMGYKEWFHYVCTFSVNGKPLNFMLGFPMSFPEKGALGWISYNGKQYSLENNPKKNGFFEVAVHPRFQNPSEETGIKYRIEYPEGPGSPYRGSVKGTYPHYKIRAVTPDLDVTITMVVGQKSVYKRDLSPWIRGAWFHSGDITATLEGTIEGKTVASTDGRGWYERNWSKIPLFWPCGWFFFMSHLDNGAVFNLLIEKSLHKRVHYLDECWLYQGGTFHTFSDYDAKPSKNLEEVIGGKNSKVSGGKIECEGKEGENSFNITGTITDLRQYGVRKYYVNIKWTNVFLETAGKATIDGSVIDMRGRGTAEMTLITYWWL